MVLTSVVAKYLSFFILVAAATEGDRIDSRNWIVYRNAATGLTFQYPPTLRIRERDVEEFNFPDTALVVDLRGDTETNPASVVLRFIVRRGEATPQSIRAKSKLLRDSPQSKSLMLDGHQAFVNVICVSTGCRWTVEVLEPRECTILTGLAGDDSKEAESPPHDGLFPLLSIIKTLHFEPAKKK